MKKKRSWLIILSLMVLLTACGGHDDKEREENRRKDKIEEKAERDDRDEEREEEREEKSTEERSEQEDNEVIYPQLLRSQQHKEEWTEYDYETYDSTQLYTVSWQSLVLDSESAKAYPKLAEKLQEMNENTDKVNWDYIEDFQVTAKEAYAENEEYFYPFSSEYRLAVVRADNHIVSVRDAFSDYMGGAHGMYGAGGLNWNPQTGELLELTDVLTSTEDLPALISEKVMKSYADEYETFEFLEETLKEYDATDYNWTMGYQGITFYFQPYEIASYAMGLIEVTIWFDEVPELFVEEYTHIPERGYVTELSLGSEIDVDLDKSDEEKNRLWVSYHYETEEDIDNGIMKLTIGLDDTSYSEVEVYGYELIPYLICVGGNYYLYVENIAENDYSIVSVYGLKQGEITLITRLNGTGFAGYWDETVGEYGTYYDYMVCNPGELKMDTRLEILGTRTGSKTYAVNKDGIPQATTEYYNLPEDGMPITSKVPLEVTMLDTDEKEELPAGTNFYMIRTDGESYADMRLEDGRECRIYVEFEDWNQTVNGIDQWECFDNLMYAG